MFGPQTVPQTAANPIVINLPHPIDPNHEKEKIKKSFPKRIMKILSILQIICGCLACILQVAHYVVDGNGKYNYRLGGLYILECGTGIIFAVSGLVGLIGAYKPSKCIAIAFLTLNIIASLITLCLIIPESLGIEDGTYIGNEYDRDVWNLHWTLLIIGLVQAVISIVAAGYSCSAVCCGQNQNNPGVVIYAPACNTNQSNLTPVALNVQATATGNSNPNTATDSTFVDVPLNTQKATENEKNDQQDFPPNYEEAIGQKYHRF